MNSGWRFCWLALLCVLMVGCASNRTPSGSSAHPLGEQAAMVALAMAGAPYRWGGDTPAGFDCSGLVYYAYQRVGREVPRTTAAQYRQARRIPMRQLSAGDLLFFRLDGSVSHVGIYTGDGRFVHAPSTGKVVSISPLDDQFWRRRLIAVGRFD